MNRVRPSIAIFIAASLYLQAVTLVNAGAWGVGTQSCADFGRLYASAQNPSIVEEIFIAWAQGFMSGADLANKAYSLGQRLNPSEGKQLSYEELSLRIRAYCDAHPLMPYHAAVSDIYLALPQK
jgi:hypothetical protein